MIWKPNTQQTVTAGTVPVTTQPGERPARPAARAGLRHQQVGLPLLLAAAGQHATRRSSSRFKVNGDTLDLASEQKILTFQHQTRPVLPLVRARCTSAPTAASTSPRATTRTRSTRPASTRSTSAPAASPGTRSARRPTRTTSTARSCAIKPIEIPTGTPGVGTTYTIPRRQPLPRGAGHDNKTRPEIFGMGFRNPFRFTVDPETGWVLMGDYGPDASTTNANRGPQGSRRVQRAHEARATTAGRTASATTRRTTTTTSRPRRPAPSSTAPRRSTTRPTTRA